MTGCRSAEIRKRSLHYPLRAHLYTIRATYTQFRPAIHNTGQLYTISLGYTQFRAGYTQFARTYTQFRVGHTRSILSVNDPPLHLQGSFSALRAPGVDIHGRTSVAGEYLRRVARRAAAPRPTEPGHLYTIPDAAIHNSRRLYTIRAAIHNSRRPSRRRTSHSRRVEERSALAPDDRRSGASSRTWIVRVSRPGIHPPSAT